MQFSLRHAALTLATLALLAAALWSFLSFPGPRERAPARATLVWAHADSPQCEPYSVRHGLEEGTGWRT